MCVFTVTKNSNLGPWLCVRACRRSSSQWLRQLVQKPRSTCRGWVSSCTLWRVSPRPANLPSHAKRCLRVSRRKQTVTVCTRGGRYRAAIVSQAAICRPRRNPLAPVPLLEAALCVVYAELSGRGRGVKGDKGGLYTFLQQFALFVHSAFLLSPVPTAAPTTCCPSWLSWLYAASVPSWCRSAPLWRSSFMRGESPDWEKTTTPPPRFTFTVPHKYKRLFKRNSLLNSSLSAKPAAGWTCRRRKSPSVHV